HAGTAAPALAFPYRGRTAHAIAQLDARRKILIDEAAMKRHALFIATVLLLSSGATGASAQTAAYPDGAECSQLSGGALIACKKRVSEPQRKSGTTGQATKTQQTIAPSSNSGGSDTAAARGVVIGAEGAAPPPPSTPMMLSAPPAGSALPGPEG